MKNECEIPMTLVLDILKTYKYQGKYMNFKKFLLKEIGIDKDSGVYAIENAVAKKVYVGSSTQLSKRIRSHVNMLKNGIHHSQHLQNAWNNALLKSFNILILDIADSKEQLLEREQYWIDYYHSYDDSHGYNISPTSSSSKGIKASDKTKAKMSVARKGKKFSSEHRMKIGIANKGKVRSPDVVAEMSRRQKGQIMPEEQKKKISESCKGINSYKRSPEVRANMSAAFKGRKAHNRKLPESTVREIKQLLAEGKSQYSLGKQFGVSKHLIFLIYHNRIWKDVII